MEQELTVEELIALINSQCEFPYKSRVMAT